MVKYISALDREVVDVRCVKISNISFCPGHPCVDSDV
jgi:hypothetical protein